MIKIFLCTDGIFPNAIGGMQRHSRLLAEYLSCYPEVDLHIVHPHKEKVFINSDKIKEHLIPGIDLNKNYLFESYKYSMRIYNLLIDYPEAIVYSQGLSVWYGINKLNNVKICNPHGLEPFQSFSVKDKIIAVPFRLIFEYIFRNCQKTVSLGGKLTVILEDILNQNKIVNLPNGVKLKEENSPNYACPVLNLIFVARFAENKGIPVLMRAIKELNEEGYEDEIHFDLVGKGPLYDDIVKGCNINNVSLHGSVTDDELEKLYKQSHAMIFPTLFEGMPTVILEAMSYSLPIIASDVGAVAEMVGKNNGYLISPGSVSELKKSIKLFLSLSHEDKKKMSKASFDIVNEKFTWEIIADKHFRLFKELLITY